MNDYFSDRTFITKHDRIVVQKDTLKIINKDKFKLKKISHTRISKPNFVSLNNKTLIEILQCDTLDAVCEYSKLNNAEYSFLIMANAVNKGGGWKKGASAQEENICRRTNLVMEFDNISYPIKNNETVMVNNITIFKKGEEDMYELIDTDKRIVSSGLLASAPFNPDIGIDGLYYPLDEEFMINKIDIMLSSFLSCNKRHIVLGAWGCGAFNNPPKHVAQLFVKALNSTKFKNQFNHIIFAILDNKYSKNYEIFKEEFKKID